MSILNVDKIQPIGSGSTVTVNATDTILTNAQAGVITATRFDGIISATTDDWITHQGDSNTRMGFPDTDTFKVETAGNQRLHITSAGKVGVGIDPTARLHVNGVSSDTAIILARAADTNGLASLNLLAEGTTGNSRILFSDTAAATGDGWISYSHNDRAFTFTTAGTGNERLRIKSGGEVRIGANSTTASTAGDDLVIEGASDRGLSIISGTSSSANIYFGDSGDADIGRIAYQHNDNALDFSVNAAGTMLRMQSDGNMRWWPDGSSGVNLYMHSNGASAITYAVYKDGSTATTCAFKNQNSSGTAKTWMEVNGDQQISIPYGMGGTDYLNIYVGADITKGINIIGQDGANQNSDSGKIHFNGYAQTNGPWIWGENTVAWGKKDLVFGTVSTTNDYTTEVGETMRLTKYGDIQWGINPNDTLWDSSSESGVYYRRSQGSFAMATPANTGYASWYINKNTGNGGSTDRRYIDFYMNNNQVGRIQENGSGQTSYGTTSDYRRKENVVSITDGITEVKKLKPYRFNFKTCDASKIVQGFFAHEAQEVVPHAVNGTKDAVKVNEKGVEAPDYQDIDYGQLTPLLTAALQEAIAKIEDLEAKLAANESGDNTYNAKIDKIIDYFKL